MSVFCLLERHSQVELTDYWGEMAVDQDHNPYMIAEEDSLVWMPLDGGRTFVAAKMLLTSD